MYIKVGQLHRRRRFFFFLARCCLPGGSMLEPCRAALITGRTYRARANKVEPTAAPYLHLRSFLRTFGAFARFLAAAARWWGDAAAGQWNDGGQLARLVQRRAVPASRAELEFALVDRPGCARLDAEHKTRMLLAELDLFGVEGVGQLVADWRRPDRRHRTRPR